MRFTDKVEYQRGLLGSIQIAVDWLLENVPKEKYAPFRERIQQGVYISKKNEKYFRYQVTFWAEALDKY